MRLICWSLFIFFAVIYPAKAEDAKFYAKIYGIVQDDYIKKVEVVDLVEAGFVGLSNMDSNVRVVNGAKTISLYYKGKIKKTLNKPAETDIDTLSKFTKKVLDAVMKVSPEISKRDFEVGEYFLMAMFDSLDESTKYYPYLDIGEKRNNKRQRYFADRMINDKILYMKFGPLNLYTRDAILSSLEKNAGFESVIIDLRGNPGGLLSEVISIVKIFLDEGIIASSKTKELDSTVFYISENDGVEAVKNKPVVVLVDGDTASSAEILAASLKHQSIAKVVGSKTKGKGSVQKLVVLDNGAELVITNAHFFTPSGEGVEGVGIRPNICTFEIDDTYDAKSVVGNAKNQTRKCYRQSRKDFEIDIDVAVKLLESFEE